MSSPASSDPHKPALRGLDLLGPPDAPAPVEQWNPEFCGDIDMRIARDGTWFYNGSPIGRPAMVKAFARLLRKDVDRYVLVTPVEKVGIIVEDAPFLGVEILRQGEGPEQLLTLRTNLDQWVEIGPKNPLRFEGGASGGLKPYAKIRGDLWALLTRALFYDLVAWGETRDIGGEAFFGVVSGGEFFAMAPMRDLAALT